MMNGPFIFFSIRDNLAQSDMYTAAIDNQVLNFGNPAGSFRGTLVNIVCFILLYRIKVEARQQMKLFPRKGVSCLRMTML